VVGCANPQFSLLGTMGVPRRGYPGSGARSLRMARSTGPRLGVRKTTGAFVHYSADCGMLMPAARPKRQSWDRPPSPETILLLNAASGMPLDSAPVHAWTLVGHRVARRGAT